jgi:GTP cyclohydrolase I
MSIIKLAHEITAPDPSHDTGRRLRVVHDREKVDQPAAERAVRDLLVALGRDPFSAHLADTPRRVARSFTEMLTLESTSVVTFRTPASGAFGAA